MSKRNVVLYYGWNHLAEVSAPLSVIENRFPSLFESRRMLYPRLTELADAKSFDQGIGGFIENILRKNFVRFVDEAREEHGCSVLEVVRGDADGQMLTLDSGVLNNADTLIVLSFDSMRTDQVAGRSEVTALSDFLSKPGNLAFVCPHHDIGEEIKSSLAEFLHHGDHTIPPQQRFGGLARSLLAGLGVPVENRYGLHPRSKEDGTPFPIQVDAAIDRHGLLQGVTNFNLHPHLPQLERIGPAGCSLQVLAKQEIDPSAPAHPFTSDGRTTFDALLQSRAEMFSGTLLVSDTTLFSSTAGGVEELRLFWKNILTRR